jgi:hypothetical protein
MSLTEESVCGFKQYGGERVLYLQKEKLREISVSLKHPFWIYKTSGNC